MSGYYVDNAMNRKLGRVGMPYGSAVHSSSAASSSSSPRVYVDNAQNQSLGRVDLPHGSAVHSGSGSNSSSPKVYVDNSLNRSLGRVGLPHGSAVHSSSSSTSSSPKVYVDNALNRSLGRVGLPHGTAVHSTAASSSSRTSIESNPRRVVQTRAETSASSSSVSSSSQSRVDQLLGPAVHSSNSQSSSNSLSTYVDNELNRRLNRVGLVKGTAIYSKSTNTITMRATPRTYVDNARNRKLGRVGMPIYSCPDSKLKCDPRQFDFNDERPPQEVQSDKKYPDHVQEETRHRTANPAEKYPNYVNEETKDQSAKLYKKLLDEEIEYLRNLKQVRNEIRANKTPKVELKPEMIIAFNELKLGKEIGTGGFAVVYVATWKNQRVAVKKLRVQRVHQAKKKQFEDEVRSIAGLDHPNVVKFYGACIVTPNLALVMELLPDGSIYDNLYFSEEQQFEDETKNQLICDSFTALKYIHSKNMVHRDIKSKNIMLCDGKTHCKLADFGLALKDDVESNASTTQFGFAGTIKYCPKEILEGNRLTIEELKLADVYSLALTSFELLTEREPFDQCKNVHQIRKAIMDGEILTTLAAEEYISTAEKELLKSALSSPQYRPSAAQFLTRFNKIIAEQN